MDIFINQLLYLVLLLLCFKLKVLQLGMIFKDWGWSVMISSEILVCWDEIDWTEVFKEGIVRLFVCVLSHLLSLRRVVWEWWSCSSLIVSFDKHIGHGAIGRSTHWWHVAPVVNWSSSSLQAWESSIILPFHSRLRPRCASSFSMAAHACLFIPLLLALGIAPQASSTLRCHLTLWALPAHLAFITFVWNYGLLLAYSAICSLLLICAEFVALFQGTWLPTFLAKPGLKAQLVRWVSVGDWFGWETIVKSILIVLIHVLAWLRMWIDGLPLGQILWCLLDVAQVPLWVLWLVIIWFCSWWANVVMAVFQIT